MFRSISLSTSKLSSSLLKKQLIFSSNKTIIRNIGLFTNNTTEKESCSSTDNNEDIDEEDLEEMFVQGPAGMEWGGPTRGGTRPEPTRYGDWERKGRASDFA